MQVELMLYIIVFIYGIIIGSFLNVLIYRLPLKENIAVTGSHCMNCNSRIQWYDLIPLVSYLLLRGKCRNCKAKISIQYPIIESFNGLGYLFIFWVSGFHIVSVLYCLVFSILIALTVIDWRYYEIPFGLNLSIAALAIIRIVLERGSLIDSLVGACAVSGFMLLVFLIGRAAAGADAFGGGDIKLMAAAGLFLGLQNIILAFLIGCVAGAVIHSILMKVCKKGRVLAFGPYLSVGIMTAMLYGDRIVSWYLGLLA